MQYHFFYLFVLLFIYFNGVDDITGGSDVTAITQAGRSFNL